MSVTKVDGCCMISAVAVH